MARIDRLAVWALLAASACAIPDRTRAVDAPEVIRFEARPFSDADSLNLDVLNVTHKVHEQSL